MPLLINRNDITKMDCEAIVNAAFPLISSGIYGYPPHKALSTALKSIHDFLGSFDGEMTVYMIVYDRNAFSAAQKLYDGETSRPDALQRRCSSTKTMVSRRQPRFSPAKAFSRLSFIATSTA